MNSDRKQFKIYGPARFSSIWAKYVEICQSDGSSASKEIRKFVKGQVAKRTPRKAQRPLMAFSEGYENAVQVA